MSGVATQPPDRVADLLDEAARWHLASLLLRRPTASRRRTVELLTAELDDPVFAAAAAAEVDEGAYLALVGPGGPVSPREVSYRPIEDPGRLLAEIVAVHEAFAYRDGGEDPRDHVAVAADFTAFLLFKEAYATRADRSTDAEVTRAARAEFIERHVRVMARGMQRRLERIGVADGFLTAALTALATIAGPPAANAAAEPPYDAPFLPAGLDEDGMFPCATTDADGHVTCSGECPWPAASRPG